MHVNDPLEKALRILEVHKKGLKRLGIITIGDLLYHFPVRYGDTSEIRSIDSVRAGESVVIFGKINNLKTSKAYRKGITMSQANITDETGSIRVVWFHQPYIAKMLHEDSFIRAEGKISD